MEYTNNTKKTRQCPETGRRKLKCKCGSVRLAVEMIDAGPEESIWLEIICKSCGETLWYSGA